MLKLVAVASALVAFTMPSLASGRDRTSADHSSAHAREARSERHSCVAAQSGERKPLAQISAKLQAQGFTVQKIESSRGCYEARVIDGNGAVIKFHIDAATGEIVDRRERD